MDDSRSDPQEPDTDPRRTIGRGAASDVRPDTASFRGHDPAPGFPECPGTEEVVDPGESTKVSRGGPAEPTGASITETLDDELSNGEDTLDLSFLSPSTAPQAI